MSCSCSRPQMSDEYVLICGAKLICWSHADCWEHWTTEIRGQKKEGVGGKERNNWWAMYNKSS